MPGWTVVLEKPIPKQLCGMRGEGGRPNVRMPIVALTAGALILTQWVSRRGLRGC
jgi:hypothetical protein